MEVIRINGTLKTPAILSDPEQGVIDIKGRSNPENAIQFYKPLFDWLTDYIKTPVDKTVVNVQLEHFNTSSSKCILEVFKKLEQLKKVEKEVVINWYYEKNDEDILEAGENYEAMTIVPFKLIPF
jgi:ribosomal protein S24E